MVFDKFFFEVVIDFLWYSAVLFALVLVDTIAEVYFSVIHIFG